MQCLSAVSSTVVFFRVVLSACSPYFQSLLLNNPCKHPIIILPRDVRYSDLRHVIEFVYKGEIDVAQEQLDNLLQTADQLQIKGLCEVSAERGESAATTPTSCLSADRREIRPSPHKFLRWPAGGPSGGGPLPRPVPEGRRKVHIGGQRKRSASQSVPSPPDGPSRCPVEPAAAAPSAEEFRPASPSSKRSRHESLGSAAPPAGHGDNDIQEAPLDLASSNHSTDARDERVTVEPVNQSKPLNVSVEFEQLHQNLALALPAPPQAYEVALAAAVAAATSTSSMFQHTHSPVSAASDSDRKLWSEENMELALDALRTARMSLSKASSVYGIPSTTLWQRAHKAGIGTPKKEGSNKNWTEEDLQLALNDLRAGRISANKASKEYGIPNSTLYKIAKKEGIKLSAPFSNAQTSWTPADLEKALDAIRGGMSVMKAGTEYGIPSGTLYGRCRRAGIERKTVGQPWSEDDMHDALETVQRGEMSINQASMYYNLPYSSLYGRIKRGALETEEEEPP
ncbi:protein bric-a-brac 2-like [Pollicipes pollicipes]|uniref:protein bric-a-brac 2-like n=1 Tax=Pollicipes pollicipes TaxID=41117 RepID=UPI0018853EBE|nr:protein bric-a-brac 2-like [Pollicipes pollicipes]